MATRTREELMNTLQELEEQITDLRTRYQASREEATSKYDKFGGSIRYAHDACRAPGMGVENW